MSPRKSSETRQGDTPKTPKVWEKARREKMKIYFNELEEVLPLYDPSAPMSRFEILQKSRSYIKELQNQNQDLLNGGFDEVYKSKMEKLKHRVKELLQRVDQLTDLLRRANIMIPPLVPCPEKQENLTLSQKWMNQRPKKWTEKINVVVPDEKIENILSLIKDFKKKSNKVGSSKKTCKNFEKHSDGKTQNGCVVKKATFSDRIELKRKKQLKKITPKMSKLLEVSCEKSDKTTTDSFSDSQSPSHAKENQPVDFNLPANEESPAESSKSAVKAVPGQDKSGSSEKDIVEDKPCSRAVVNNDKIGLVTGKVKNLIDSQNNVFLPASTNVVQSNTFLLTNDGNLVQFPILNSSGNVFSTNPNLLTQTAIVNQPNSGLLTPLVINRPSPVIVLQKPTPHIQIVNPTPQILSVPNQNIQILRNSILCPTTSQSSKTLPYILSKQPPNKKRITKDSTMTTFVNKIPIPALSKQSYVKKNINCIGGKGKTASPKVKEKEKCESEKSNANEAEEVQSNESISQTEKVSGAPSCDGESEKSKENEEGGEHLIQKRTVTDEDNTNAKKQKLSNENSDDHVFKPIENPILSDPPESNENIFCNLKLSGSMGHNLSVSPTAAFLSTFPIVASSKLEDELSGKMDDRRNCEEKDDKIDDDKSKDKEGSSLSASELVEVHKGCDGSSVTLDGKESAQVEKEKERSESDQGLINKTNCDMNTVESNLNTNTESNTSIAKENSTSIISNSTSNNNNNNNNNNASNNTNNNNISNNNNNNNINNSNNNNNNNSNTTTTNNNNINNNNTSTNNNNNSTSNNNNIINNSVNQCTQLISAEKTWEDFQQPKNCEVRADPFYIHSEVQNANGGISDMPGSISSFPGHGANVYKNSYPQNNMKTNFNGLTDQMNVKNNQFDYGQKDNFLTKQMAYNERNAVKKSCLTVNDSYAMGKNQSSMYQTEQSPNYQLVPVKEMSNQRNARPPVNWMTDPDVRTRSMSYGGASKISSFAQPDASFYGNNQASKQSDDYVLADVNKLSYQKNEFYGNKNDAAMKGQCKNLEKRGDPKFPAKPTSQNTYNIFDYNYNGNYFGEEDANKFCNVQNFNVKNKKNSLAKKKSENAVHIINGDQQNDPGKRNTDQIITNLDFNTVGNQECFSWVPGKNVEWLPSKSFVDTNLMLPSTLPTLVGDLALGTTTSDVTQTKGPRPNQKTSIEPMGKSYIDLNLGSNASFGKDPESNKQYLEPFINLSKNIFDLTPSNNTHNPQKNDCDKNGYLSNANETIVLKNIFELPVSKSFTNDFPSKQRPVNNSQNTFLSVSQLVETPNYESNSIKNEASLEGGVAKQTEPYSQSYSNYHGNQKSYKNKNRNSHYKYNDRKYHGYKNGSSNYTAEALIRSNANLTYQSNEFQTEVNSNFYNKTNQKSDNFPAANEPIIPCSTQNIYSDFNFSSPVPNFNISTSVAADYVAHDGNFSSQNNSFFGDFIPPEYPITESVSNSLLLPPCSIALQNPFIIEKRNGTPEKGAKPQKHYSNTRSRKNFDCTKTSYSDFPTSAGIFTNPTIFTTSSCQNLLPVPNQNMSDPNITFSTPSFSTGNITFPPPLTSNTNTNYQRVTGAHNPTTTTFFPASCHSMFTTCSTTTVTSSRTCLSTIPHTSSSAVITTPFSVGNTPFPSSTQSSLPFLSLSNPIVPPSVPSTSGNTLANFNLSTIFPEINQKGNYHYP